MGVSRQPVAELWVQSQGPGLVPTSGAASPPAQRQDSGDLREWAHRTSLSAGKMIGGGLALASAGVAGAMMLSVGLFGVVALSSMFTIGGGLTFLGLVKLKGRPPEPKALPEVSPQVLAERSRRVRSVLERGEDYTFERLLAEMRWTESALLETLVAMKESGQIVEDLNLETGQWVYRWQVADYNLSAPGAMTLADRQAQRAPLPEQRS